ncbi:MAG: C45 family peptidase [archaeon]
MSFSVSGTNFECGLSLGKRFSKEISKRVDILVSDAKLKEFGVQLTELDLRCRRKFPQFALELEGISVGAGQPYTKLLFLNMLEYHGHGCSSIALHDKTDLIVAHNEDGDVWENRDDFSLVNFSLSGIQITYFSYPGELGGSAYAWNSHGLFMCVNNLHPKPNLHMLPKAFISRRILESKNIGEAISVLKMHKTSGYHYFIAQGEKIISIEVFDGNINVEEVKGYSCHTNHYLSGGFAGKDDPRIDSTQRLSRLNQLIKKGKKPIQILYDRKGENPIFCENQPSLTLSTVVAYPRERSVLIYNNSKYEDIFF